MEKKMIAVGGETLAYMDIGTGEPVLLIHGNFSSGIFYHELYERLNDKFRFIVPDLRGFGDSSYNATFDTLAELAGDLAGLLDALEVESAYVVGWSLGGGVAMELAAHYPDKVRKLFIIEGVGCKGYPLFKDDGSRYMDKTELVQNLAVGPMLAALSGKMYAAIEAAFNATIHTVGKPDAEESQKLYAESVKERCLVDADWALAAFNMSDEDTAYTKTDHGCKKIKCPVCLTLADKDVIVPNQMVWDNYNALGELATMVKYENCGHSPFVDCPDKLAADVAEFFGK